MSENKLPAFFKDQTGFCYTATHLLAKVPGLEPWDGEVDAFGFATETKERQAKGAKKKSADTTTFRVEATAGTTTSGDEANADTATSSNDAAQPE